MDEASTSTADASEVVGSHAGTIDLSRAHETGTEHQRTGTENARTGCGGPMCMRIALKTLGYIILGILIAISIALSASSLQKSNEALALANSNTQLIESELSNENTVVIDYVEKEKDVVGGNDASTATTIASDPTSKPTTSSPTKPHPLNPKWFQTTHVDYQMFLNATGGNAHEWHVSNLLCSKQNKYMICPYETYCPSGKGGEPYGGGPPIMHNSHTLEETQWAPYRFDPDTTPLGDPSNSHWVQIGLLSTKEGGTNENNFLKCWKYDDWYGGNGVDVVNVWEEGHRMWILCCDREEEVVVENTEDDEDMLDV